MNKKSKETPLFLYSIICNIPYPCPSRMIKAPRPPAMEEEERSESAKNSAQKLRFPGHWAVGSPGGYIPTLTVANLERYKFDVF